MKQSVSPTLQVEYVPVQEIRANEYNAKRFTSDQKAQITESIKRFGFVDPVICNSAGDRKNILIGGHGRLMVAIELGIEKIPVVYVDIPDLNKEKELNLRLHKNQGEFDLELLSAFDETLLENVGFNSEEIDGIFISLDTENDDFSVEDELKKIKEATAKTGDLYQLGPHRLYCGDSTHPESIKKVTGGAQIDMVYCDPVYNTRWLSYDRGIGGKSNYGGTTNDNRTDEEYSSFLEKTMRNALSVCGKNAHVFYYCDETYVPMIATLYQKLGIDFRRICIWLKGVANPTPQVAFSKVYEPCVYGTIGKPYLSPHHRNYDEVLNKDIGTGNEMIGNFMDMFDVWAVQRLAGNQYEHPTEKPVTLHDKPIRRCTKVGGTILSLFGGSGGEMIASHQLKRTCYMVEMEPVFVDLIIRRFEKLTGEKAVKLS